MYRTRRSRPVHRSLAATVAMLYASLALGISVIHAETECITAGAAFESTHTAQCLPIHDEAHCPAHAARHLPPPAPASPPQLDDGTPLGHGLVAAAVPPAPSDQPTPSVRAPPA